MKKYKLLIAISLAIVLLFGTSLTAIGILSIGGDKEDMGKNNSPSEFNTASHDDVSEPLIDEAAKDLEVQEDQAEAEETADVNVEKAEEPKEVKTKAKPEKPAPPEQKQTAKVNVNDLNLRPDPSINNTPIDVLMQGQTVDVLGEQNSWLQVKLPDGRTGWVYGVYVDKLSASANNDSSPPVSKESSLAGKVIVLDPGHGGTDPGAVGVTGLPEKEVVLDVSLRAAKKLRALGAKVIMTRDTDVFIPLTQRVTIAHNAGAAVFVSVHANAHPSSQIGGTETYYYANKAAANASRNLASFMQKQMVGALKLRDIGVKSADFLVIRQTSMPSVLLELGFLSNAHEESLLRTNDFRQRAADAIVRALQGYFK